jgi:hypothetical protein
VSLETAAHKAIHDALVDPALTELRALIGTRVYDRVPPTAIYPYVTVSVEVTDDSNTCSSAFKVQPTVTVNSASVGQVEAETIGGIIRSVLAPHDIADWISIAAHTVVASDFDTAVYRPGDEPGLSTEGVLIFTYLVDPLTEET